jgi:hypothetical protein
MGIEIQIKAGLDAASSSVSANGSVQHIITDLERTSFKLNDSQLKDAVKIHNDGHRPDDAYLHSPTPWNDLYKTYNWSQVQTVIVVESAKILEITSEPEIIAQETFSNTSSVKGTFNCGISDTVTNTTGSSWTNSNAIEVDQTFKYDVSFLGTGGGGETSLKYTHSWSDTKTESTSVTVGQTSGVSVDLQPGQSVLAVLSASRGTMKVQITYRAYLTGGTAVNYGNKYNGHHFWYYDIGSIMAGNNISNSITVSEVITIGYYANASIQIKDK